MKQAMLYFACDTCGEESPPAAHWVNARKLAKYHGWWLGRDGAALCPPCWEEWR